MRVSCMSPLWVRFCAILCNSGKIGEAVPKKPPKKTPDPGPSGCFQAVEIPFPHRGTRQRTAKVQPGFHPFPADSAPFHLSAMARRIVGKGFAGALRGVCMALARGGAQVQGRAARPGRKERGAQAPSGKRWARWRQPEPRARPTNAPARRGRRRKGDSRGGVATGNPKGGVAWAWMKPRRVPLRFAPFGVIRRKGESGKGVSKGGKLKGETALTVPPAAWNIPRFGGLGANRAPGASGAARQHMGGMDGVAGHGPAMCGRRIGRLWAVWRTSQPPPPPQERRRPPHGPQPGQA